LNNSNNFSVYTLKLENYTFFGVLSTKWSLALSHCCLPDRFFIACVAISNPQAIRKPAATVSLVHMWQGTKHSALRAAFAQQLSPSNAPASIRTQPHFAQHESAALRPPGSTCAALPSLLPATACIRSRLLALQQPAFARSCISLIPASAAHQP